MDYLITILINAEISTILALSTYVVISSGQLTVCQGAFFGIGAYVSAWFTVVKGFHFIPAMILGGIVASILGLMVSIPASRVRGIYFAIVTLAFGEVVRSFFLIFKYIVVKDGKTLGFQGPLGFRFIYYFSEHGINNFHVLELVSIMLLVLVIIFHIFEKSRMGFSFKSCNEDEIAALSIGLNVNLIRSIALGAGAFIAALAGAIHSHFITLITPSDIGFSLSFLAIIFVVIGGRETFWGAFAGAFFLTFLPETIRFFKDYRMISYGILLIIIMIFRRRGLIDGDLVRRVGTLLSFKRFGSLGS